MAYHLRCKLLIVYLEHALMKLLVKRRHARRMRNRRILFADTPLIRSEKEVSTFLVRLILPIKLCIFLKWEEDDKKLESWKQVLEECDRQDAAFANDSAKPDDAAAVADTPARYEASFLVQYCVANWSGWVNKIHGTLVKSQAELDVLPYPTRHLINVIKGLEVLLPSMMQVIMFC